MKPRKRGKQYEISYRCSGYDRPFYERFPTLEEAKIRCAEIELAQARGDLRPPQKTDVAKKEHITVAGMHVSPLHASLLLFQYKSHEELSKGYQEL